MISVAVGAMLITKSITFMLYMIFKVTSYVFIGIARRKQPSFCPILCQEDETQETNHTFLVQTDQFTHSDRMSL